MLGTWTMAEMSASVNVGWNGRTAEVSAEASIKSCSPDQITYGFNLFYSVVRLTPNGNWAADIWAQPGILFEGGVLQSKDGSSVSAPPYSKSDSLDGRAVQLGEGTYRVQAEITVTAQPPDDKVKIDELSVPDSEDLTITLNPLNE